MIVTLADDSAGHLEGSHLCGNGSFCLGFNCVIWELANINCQRIECHAKAVKSKTASHTFSFGPNGLGLSKNTPKCVFVDGGRAPTSCKRPSARGPGSRLPQGVH